MGRNIIINLILVMSFILTGCSTDAVAYEPQPDLFRVTVIDVGKGDCILVETGSNKVMIDTGYKATSDSVIDYLNGHGIDSLDAMIISHYDKDHVGGAKAVIDSFNVVKLYLPDYVGTRSGYEDMIDAAKKNNVPYEYVKQDGSFTLGDAVYYLYPSTLEFDGEDDDDMSLAAAVRYHDHSALFTGDMEEGEMPGFISGHKGGFEKCDILKMPHHGRLDDQTEELIDMVSPEIILVTDGKGWKMEGSLKALLDDRAFEYYTSAVDGTITVTGTSDQGYLVETNEEQHEIVTDQSGLYGYEKSSDGTAVIMAYYGNESDITIPETLDGIDVKEIGPDVFYDRADIKSVSVPGCIEKIGDGAFYWCRKLESVSVGEGTSIIGDGAFGCDKSLKEAYLPSTLTKIGKRGFRECKKLDDIFFAGSRDQWDLIKKGDDWDKSTPGDMNIRCYN